MDLRREYSSAILLADKINKVHRLDKEKELKFIDAEERRFLKLKNFEDSVTSKQSLKFERFESPKEVIIQNEKSNSRSCQHEVQDIHQLLITNGEIDPEKILCLHALALKVPSSIDESDEDVSTIPYGVGTFTRYSKLLPNYYLKPTEKKDKNNREKSVTKHRSELSINQQIETIIFTVISVLKEVNQKKLDDLVAIIQNPNIVGKILMKDSSIEFISELYKSGIITSTKSYQKMECYIMSNTSKIKEQKKRKGNIVFILSPPPGFPLFEPLSPELSAKDLKEESFNSMAEVYQKIAHGKTLTASNSAASIGCSSSSALALLSDQGSDISLVTGRGSGRNQRHDLMRNITFLLKASELVDNTVDSSDIESIDTRLGTMSLSSEPSLLRYDHEINKQLEAEIDYYSKCIYGEEEEVTERDLNIRRIPKRVDCNQFKKERLKNRLLRRFSNNKRVMLANEVSRLKTRDIQRGILNSKVDLTPIIGKVMTKKSLIKITRISPKNERNFILKPQTSGGMGFGHLIIGAENVAKLKKLRHLSHTKKEACKLLEDKLLPTPSRLNVNDIYKNSKTISVESLKQEISMIELDKKCNKFIKQLTAFNVNQLC